VGDKPQIGQQIETFIVSILKKKKMKIKCGTGGEEKRAKEGLSKLVKVALFVNERRDTLGRSQMTKYASSDILDLIQYSIRSKACQGKLVSLSKEEVGNEFKKACDALHAFPSS